MKLTRWAVSLGKSDGSRVVCGGRYPTLKETRKSARNLRACFPKECKARVERVIIDIPGID